MVYKVLELHALGSQERELPLPCITVRQCNSNVVDCHRHAPRGPVVGRRRQIWAFHQRHVVVVETITLIAAIEAHLWRVRPGWRGLPVKLLPSVTPPVEQCISLIHKKNAVIWWGQVLRVM
jgi:hypothetical protein